MRIDVLTLFPEVCEPYFSASILGRAREAGLAAIQCHNIRDYAEGRHSTVDDRPFGGGTGMVMMCQPVFDAVEAVEKLAEEESTRVLLTPQGERLTQAVVGRLAQRPRLLVIAGHYEGFDERIRLGLSPWEVSIGDYVLSGGEAAAMVLVDAVVRLIPGVLGNPDAAGDDSFSIPNGSPMTDGSENDPTLTGVCLEYPQYTRPRVFRGMEVPEILLSGDHAKIRAWRAGQARLRTASRRPDLLAPEGPGGRSDEAETEPASVKPVPPEESGRLDATL